MARIEEVDRLLWLWAEKLKCGDGSGYPTKSTLHPSWSPPGPGVTPSMKVVRGGGGEMTRHVESLPDSLKATVVARYLLRMSDCDAAGVLGCAEVTVKHRVVRAQQIIAGRMADQAAAISATTT